VLQTTNSLSDAQAVIDAEIRLGPSFLLNRQELELHAHITKTPLQTLALLSHPTSTASSASSPTVAALSSAVPVLSWLSHFSLWTYLPLGWPYSTVNTHRPAFVASLDMYLMYALIIYFLSFLIRQCWNALITLWNGSLLTQSPSHHPINAAANGPLPPTDKLSNANGIVPPVNGNKWH